LDLLRVAADAIERCSSSKGGVGRALMSPLLLELWREQHPHGHVQTALNF